MPTLIAIRQVLSILLLKYFDFAFHAVRGETEVREKIRRLARCAVAIEPEHPPLASDVPPPGQPGPGLDGESPGHGAWQHTLAPRLVLRIEDVGRRHRHEPDARAGGIHCLNGLSCDADL